MSILNRSWYYNSLLRKRKSKPLTKQSYCEKWTSSSSQWKESKTETKEKGLDERSYAKYSTRRPGNRTKIFNQVKGMFHPISHLCLPRHFLDRVKPLCDSLLHMNLILIPGRLWGTFQNKEKVSALSHSMGFRLLNMPSFNK